MVEHVFGKDEVAGSIPASGSKNNNKHMAVKKRPFSKLQCQECKRINYFTRKSKEAVEKKLGLKKFCKFCRKHTLHKETKR